VVVALLAFLLVGVAAAVVVAVLGTGVVAWTWLGGGPLALRLAGAVPADESAHARLHNLTDGLCVTTGLPKPALYVVHDAAANAFAVGRDPRRSAVVVTTGLLDALGRIELEGLLAQALAHIRSRDTQVATLAVALPPARRLLDPEREQVADLAAVEITRYPPGLVAALEQLQRTGTAVQRSPFAMAHLWMAPAAERPGTAADAVAPALEARIAVLREL
jgi:heat shock protein HtpX